MQSRTVPGLYFIGEVVVGTGWLGGYNFQWAWASGYAAGRALQENGLTDRHAGLDPASMRQCSPFGLWTPDRVRGDEQKLAGIIRHGKEEQNDFRPSFTRPFGRRSEEHTSELQSLMS